MAASIPLKFLATPGKFPAIPGWTLPKTRRFRRQMPLATP
jgi:hypothetical protein